jgi:hypothetical protein
MVTAQNGHCSNTFSHAIQQQPALQIAQYITNQMDSSPVQDARGMIPDNPHNIVKQVIMLYHEHNIRSQTRNRTFKNKSTVCIPYMAVDTTLYIFCRRLQVLFSKMHTLHVLAFSV